MASRPSAARSLLLWGASLALILLGGVRMAGLWLVDRDPLKRATGGVFRRLGLSVARLHRARVQLEGPLPEAAAAFVVVANHQSLADAPALCHLPWEMKWIAKAELFRMPIFGWMLRLARDIPFDRTRRTGAGSAFRQAQDVLAAGCPVMVFPEGTRSRDGSVGAFQDGAFRLAIAAGVPVLPVAIDGAGAWMPRGTWRFGPPPHIRVRVFAPIGTEGLTAADAERLAERARRQIAEQVGAWRAEA
jgi:1-acyl-sn-glycerol-3-phosphate acyltransferase